VRRVSLTALLLVVAGLEVLALVVVAVLVVSCLPRTSICLMAFKL
jgi:hypothetical protein